MTSQSFDNFLLMIASSPFGRLFFCKRDIFDWLEPCVEVETLFKTDNYIMFQALPPRRDQSFQSKGKSCIHQQCRSCKGYGLIHPMLSYNHLYTLGLTSFRKILKSEWTEIIHNEDLFMQICEIYNKPVCVEICVQCLVKNKCSLKNARRECSPVKFTNNTCPSPFFNPPARSGIFPFLIDNNHSMVLCNNTTIKAGSSGTVQSGMGDKPRFYAAKIKSSFSIIEIPQHVWDITFQYAIARHYGFSFRVKPFIPTVDIHAQYHFGKDFKKIEDHSDFLWRFRPFIRHPFIAKIERVGMKLKREVLPFELDYHSVINPNLRYRDRIFMGLKKVFGYGTFEVGGPFFMWN